MCNWIDGDVKRMFESRMASRPWTLGYRTVVSETLQCDQPQITGAFPAGLAGTLYRNGPAGHERGDQRYAHRWDGDGMIQAWRIRDGQVRHHARMVATSKYVQESEAGRFLFSGFGSNIQEQNAVGIDIDKLNAANISAIMVAGELLALWEPGSAYRVDPLTLETLGVKTWEGRGIVRPFSAHPKVDPDGTLWNFGANPMSDELSMYRIDTAGRVQASHMMRIDQLPAIHDFMVTHRHLVFLLPPMVFDAARARDGAAVGEAMNWRPELATRVLVVSKADFSHRWYELPPAAMYHMGNAWEDAQGDIRFEYMSAPDPRGVFNSFAIMTGEYEHVPGAFMTNAVLPRNGPARQHVNFALEAEFPTVLASRVGLAHEKVLCLGRSAGVPSTDPGWDCVVLASPEGEELQRYTYPTGWMAEEHVYAGPGGAIGQPWVLGTALDVTTAQTVLSVFAADRIADGPIAQARLPYGTPLGLHGVFSAAR